MNGEMWVLGGGRIAPNPSNQVDIYNPGTDTWSTGLPFTTGTAQLPGRQRRDRPYLAGWRLRRSRPAVVNTMQVFGPGVCPTPTPSPTPVPPTPDAPHHHSGTPTLPHGNAKRRRLHRIRRHRLRRPSPTPSPTAPPAQAVNFSTRMFVRTGDHVGIGGFIVREALRRM